MVEHNRLADMALRPTRTTTTTTQVTSDDNVSTTSATPPPVVEIETTTTTTTPLSDTQTNLHDFIIAPTSTITATTPTASYFATLSTTSANPITPSEQEQDEKCYGSAYRHRNHPIYAHRITELQEQIETHYANARRLANVYQYMTLDQHDHCFSALEKDAVHQTNIHHVTRALEALAELDKVLKECDGI